MLSAESLLHREGLRFTFTGCANGCISCNYEFLFITKKPNLKIVLYQSQSRNFSKSNFQCGNGTDSPGTRKPSVDL